MKYLRYRIYAVVDKETNDSINNELENLQQYGAAEIFDVEIIPEKELDIRIDLDADFKSFSKKYFAVKNE